MPDVVATKTFPEIDIFVVGSGIAALVLAERAASKGKKLLVIEGGGAEETDENRALTLSDEYGHYHNHWSNHWVRAVGGTSRRWAGYLARLDENNFDHVLPLARWPISLADLLPHYQQALAFFGRESDIVNHHQWSALDNSLLLRPLSRGRPMQIRSLDTFSRIRNTVIQSGHHLVRLESGSRRRVEYMLLKPDDGSFFRVGVLPGQHVVLACGGLGNAQILMQPQEDSAVGVGNESGYAGKCLMEHLHAVCATVYLSSPYYDQLVKQADDRKLGLTRLTFALPATDIRSRELLDCSLWFRNVRPATNSLADYFRNQWGSDVIAATVIALAEQEPLPNNAVQIVNEQNRAGLYRLRTECVLTERDLRSIYETTRLMGERLLANKVGAARIYNQGIFRESEGSGHTMGTTRMGEQPRNSVCDRHAKVHGYSNLHIAGSSLFSSGGAVNPTLTIVALALRLADHLS